MEEDEDTTGNLSITSSSFKMELFTRWSQNAARDLIKFTAEVISSLLLLLLLRLLLLWVPLWWIAPLELFGGTSSSFAGSFIFELLTLGALNRSPSRNSRDILRAVRLCTFICKNTNAYKNIAMFSTVDKNTTANIYIDKHSFRCTLSYSSSSGQTRTF